MVCGGLGWFEVVCGNSTDPIHVLGSDQFHQTLVLMNGN